MQKGFRPYWTNPGLSELPRPVLDQTINRDLHVKRDLVIDGDLTVSGDLGIPWNSYTPTLLAYTVANGSVVATGMVFTISGRWKAIGTLLFFYVYCNITDGGNSGSNFFIGLPPKLPIIQSSVHGTLQLVGNTERTRVRSITGIIGANASTVMIFPTDVLIWSGSSVTGYYNMCNIDFSLNSPYEFNFSGFYEST
jgi:uncharacterized membrane protein